MRSGIRTTGTRRSAAAFSLIELVIVVVIIAIIGAIAIPKMSRGASGAAESSLIQNLAILRQGLDMYQTEHGGAYPTAANMPGAFSEYSDDQGNHNPDKTTFAAGVTVYGPYVRTVPTLPLGANKGASGIDVSNTGGTIGWIYEPGSGKISANTSAGEKDSKNVLYSAY